MTPIKVLIVDDSRVARELLAHIIEADPDLKVAGFAENGAEALRWLQHQACDVITMDIQMPSMNGFEVTREIMATTPTPIVIVSAIYTNTDKQMSFRALEAGALVILEKPSGFQDATYQEKAKEVIDTIKMIAGIKTVRRTSHKLKEVINASFFNPKQQEKIKAIGIGASLGGPVAICKILSELSPTFPVPIFVVQHIAKGFTESFARWLQSSSKLRVCIAQDQEKAQPGFVYVAGDNHHMEVKKGDIISLSDHEETKHQPSIGRLLQSMADTYGAHCAGVLLTGMGSDGAKELLVMKRKGAYTIAQDEESCVMFGIPKEAILLGAAKHVVPLEKIAHVLNDLVN